MATALIASVAPPGPISESIKSWIAVIRRSNLSTIGSANSRLPRDVSLFPFSSSKCPSSSKCSTIGSIAAGILIPAFMASRTSALISSFMANSTPPTSAPPSVRRSKSASISVAASLSFEDANLSPSVAREIPYRSAASSIPFQSTSAASAISPMSVRIRASCPPSAPSSASVTRYGSSVSGSNSPVRTASSNSP